MAYLRSFTLTDFRYDQILNSIIAFYSVRFQIAYDDFDAKLKDLIPQMSHSRK